MAGIYIGFGSRGVVLSNSTFINCDKGIVIDGDADVSISNSNFHEVGKCYEVLSNTCNYYHRNPIYSRHVKKAIQCDTSRKAEYEARNIVSNLFNLEIYALIANHKEDLQLIRKLKGQVGSHFFAENYPKLKTNLLGDLL